MKFDHPDLVAKYGSWVRVQVEFYDFLFEKATKLCAEQWTLQEACDIAMSGGFREGHGFFEASVKAIEGEWRSLDAAWADFIKRESKLQAAGCSHDS